MASREAGGPPEETQGLKSWHYICEIPEFTMDWSSTALIVIDLQYQQISRNHGFFKRLAEAGLTDDAAGTIDRIEQLLVPNVQKLTAAFRENGAPVIYTRCVSVRGDGSDQTRRHIASRRRSSGLSAAKTSWRGPHRFIHGRLPGRVRPVAQARRQPAPDKHRRALTPTGSLTKPSGTAYCAGTRSANMTPSERM